MAILKVDKNKCIGCGTCVSLCPDFFEMGADGKAQVINSIKDIDKSKAEEIVASCPMGAITSSQK